MFMGERWYMWFPQWLVEKHCSKALNSADAGWKSVANEIKYRFLNEHVERIPVMLSNKNDLAMIEIYNLECLFAQTEIWASSYSVGQRLRLLRFNHLLRKEVCSHLLRFNQRGDIHHVYQRIGFNHLFQIAVFFCSRGGPGIHTDIVTRHIRNGVQRRKNGKENQGK